MEVIYSPDALADIDHWKRIGNRAVLAKISALVTSIGKTPSRASGNPSR